MTTAKGAATPSDGGQTTPANAAQTTRSSLQETMAKTEQEILEGLMLFLTDQRVFNHEKRAATKRTLSSPLAMYLHREGYFPDYDGSGCSWKRVKPYLVGFLRAQGCM